MQTKCVKCPKCGTGLEVKNSKNEAVKVFACPNCKTKLQVKFSAESAPLEAHTMLGPQRPQANDGATQLGGAVAGSGNGSTQIASPQTFVRQARLECDGKAYDLELGQNTIGRKAQTSHATVQIDTTDRYMSRQHALITVTRLRDGGLKATLRNDQNKNDTLVNGQTIANGDEIRLINGCRITMGHTTLLYKEK